MIPKLQTLLYATDLTSNAAQAFRYAIATAEAHGAEIHILHVMAEMDASVVNYMATVIGEERFADLELDHESEMREQIRVKLEAFRDAELKDRPEAVTRVKSVTVCHGYPPISILEEADRLNADLIIMGTHGKGALRYTFLGSVAEKVLRKSKRPVMVIPLPPV